MPHRRRLPPTRLGASTARFGVEITDRAVLCEASYRDGSSTLDELARKMAARRGLTDDAPSVTVNVGLAAAGEAMDMVPRAHASASLCVILR